MLFLPMDIGSGGYLPSSATGTGAFICLMIALVIGTVASIYYKSVGAGIGTTVVVFVIGFVILEILIEGVGGVLVGIGFVIAIGFLIVFTLGA